MKDGIIHICWNGPINLDDVKTLNNDDSDYGIYQVYSHHPVYGQNLTYIGKAREQTFAARIGQHRWDTGLENNPRSVQIHVGRLKGGSTPSLNDWRSQIDVAEALLIHAHAPAYNSTFVMNSPSAPFAGHVRVLSWGAVRSLQREVSGLIWTVASEQFNNLKIFRASEITS